MQLSPEQLRLLLQNLKDRDFVEKKQEIKFDQQVFFPGITTKHRVKTPMYDLRKDDQNEMEVKIFQFMKDQGKQNNPDSDEYIHIMEMNCLIKLNGEFEAIIPPLALLVEAYPKKIHSASGIGYKVGLVPDSDVEAIMQRVSFIRSVAESLVKERKDYREGIDAREIVNCLRIALSNISRSNKLVEHVTHDTERLVLPEYRNKLAKALRRIRAREDVKMAVEFVADKS